MNDCQSGGSGCLNSLCILYTCNVVHNSVKRKVPEMLKYEYYSTHYTTLPAFFAFLMKVVPGARSDFFVPALARFYRAEPTLKHDVKRLLATDWSERPSSLGLCTGQSALPVRSGQL